MRAGVWAVLALAAASPGCDAGDDAPAGTDTPMLESAAPRYLEEELARVVEDVRGASEASGAEERAEKLADASGRLEGLTAVYLPLYRARVEAANAYRLYARGEGAEAERALERAEESILAVSRGSPGRLDRELETAAGQVAQARVGVVAGSPDAEPHLRRLVETLTDLLERAGLVL